MRHLRLLLIPCLYWIASLLPSHAQTVEASLSSHYLLPGEKAILEFILVDAQGPENFPIEPIFGLNIQKRGFGPNTITLPSRNIAQVYQFIVSATTQGTYTIPAISLRYPNKEIFTKALTLEVINPQDISTQEVIVDNRRVRYASFFRAAKTNPYEGEIVPVELKVYFPADIDVEEWGIPDFERNSVTAWRFEPRPQPGFAVLLGQNCQVATYPSNFSAIKAGKVSIGPAKIRLITDLVSFGPFGSVSDLIPINITTPKLEIESRPLPEGAPDSFTNAVGSFTMDIGVSEKEVREGDPVNVDIEISGSGNLDSLDAPKLSDPEGWKLYDATRSQLGEERRYGRGMIRFTQFMRPTQRQTVIPPFNFSFFDPILEKYQTLSSSPIALTLLPSTNVPSFISPSAPPAADVPVERMSDILGLISNAPILNPHPSSLSADFWHFIPAALFLALLIVIAKRQWLNRLQPATHVQQQRNDWKNLTKSSNENFLRDAARFIERWHHHNQNPDLAKVIEERDLQCFLPEPSQVPIPQSRKSQILATLRKLLPLLLLFLFLPHADAQETSSSTPPPPVPQNAEELYKKGQNKEAIEAWLAAGSYESLSPQTRYNIGNACYRMGLPGHAALYYRRALMSDPTLIEANQNLRFLERKFGSITIKRPDYQLTLGKLPLAWIKNATWGALWAIVLAITLIFATNFGSKFRILSLITLIFAPFLLAASILAWRYYPNDAIFAPFEQQAVITGENAVLRTDASRTSGEVMENAVPPGSLCRIIRRTGKWCYVSFATQSSGWVESDQVETLIPEKPPTVPKLKSSAKADDDDPSA